MLDLRQDSRLASYVNAGLDPKTADPTLLRRTQVLNLVMPPLMVLGSPFVVRYLSLGFYDLALVLAAALAVAAGNLVLLRRSLNPYRAGQISICLLFAMLLYVDLSFGGFAAPSFIWFGVVPLAAILLVDVRSGWIWTGVTVLTTLVLWRLDAEGVLPPSRMPPSSLASQALLSRLSAIVAIAVLTSWSVFLRRQAERALRAQVEERQRAEQDAQAASRTKSDFLASVSHEIRTPMSGVLGMSDLLLRAKLAPRQMRQVEVIHSSAEALLNLVDDILDLSKIEAGRLELEEEDFPLRHHLGRIVQLLAPPAAEKGLELHLDVSEAVPDSLNGDAARLGQILLNLTGNAIKFTDEGGVTLSVYLDVEAAEDPRLCFVVRDTGQGISPEAQKRVFEAYAQAESSTARQFGGTGLGLTISRELVHLMGGTLRLDSETGRGSTFSFSIPLRRAREEPAPEAAAAARRPSDGAPAARRPVGEAVRALVVDDNETNRFVARSHLEGLGLSADAVSGGAEALQAASERRYDVVFMDCQMPELDGYETTRRLRQLEGPAAGAVIVALTARAMKGERERCLEAGMNDYLTKPFRVEDLAAVLRRWVPGWESAEEGEAPGAAEDRGGSAEPASSRIDGERLATLRRLEKATGQDVVTKLISSFAKTSEKCVADLRRTLAAGDAVAFERAAHSLVGSAGNLGAVRLAELARALEDEAAEGGLEGFAPRIGEVEEERRAALAELEALDGG